MEKPIFSIIIPCYNIEKYISTTIKSVLNQTFDNFELILINDGSKDKTYEIIKFYSKQDKRISIIDKINEGVSKTRNLGINLAKGKYLYFLDGDDYIENNLLEKANFIFQKEEIEIFSFGYDIRNGQSLKNCSNDKYDKKLLTSKEFLKNFLKREINQSICSLIVRKDILKEVKFNTELTTGEDLDFQMNLLLINDFRIFYDSFLYFHYIKRTNSATTKKKIPLKNLNTLDSLNLLRKSMLLKNISEFREYHIIRFFSIIKSLSENGFERKNYQKIKNKLKESEYILKDLKFKFDKKSIILNVLKLFYKINLKYLLFNFKIYELLSKRRQIKF